MELVGGTHLTFRGGNGVWVGDGLTLRGVADDDLAATFESDDGWGGHSALWVWDDLDFAISLHVADDGIGGTKVDTNDNFFCHNLISPFRLCCLYFRTLQRLLPLSALLSFC